MPATNSQTIVRAKAVLAQNDRGDYTVPSPQLYPHQWLWDSGFIAIGLSTYQPRRAVIEIRSLFRGQWQNGMLPHIIFNDATHYWQGPRFWQSQRSRLAPHDVATSAMTQPPLPAIACLETADRMSPPEAQQFLKGLWPKLVGYHQWIYQDRDPDGSGLAILFHPWESGLDNTPPWMELLKKSSRPYWLSLIRQFGLEHLLGRLRQDTNYVPANQRETDYEAFMLAHRALRYRKRHYNSQLHLRRSRELVEDLTFNSILIAANRSLLDIATIIDESIPPQLRQRMMQTEAALEELWDETTGQYYHRNFRTGQLILEPSLATFLPLFAGSINTERARRLVRLLAETDSYGLPFPVPSVPRTSNYFSPLRYWQGPTWLNTNWMIIKGLLKFGYTAEATKLINQSLALVETAGFYEYFSPIDGHGYGINNFSWTAALYLELVALRQKLALTKILTAPVP
ncbi:glycoside hydrolase [Candidatus Microgenomates bacterium]|nr:glycoside hydrolase [Candidatus Microgenomates bacterium]